MLFEKYGLQVLGVEGDKSRVIAAINRQNKFYKTSRGHVSYVQHFITIESAGKIISFAHEFFPQGQNFYLIGIT